MSQLVYDLALASIVKHMYHSQRKRLKTIALKGLIWNKHYNEKLYPLQPKKGLRLILQRGSNKDVCGRILDPRLEIDVCRELIIWFLSHRKCIISWQVWNAQCSAVVERLSGRRLLKLRVILTFNRKLKDNLYLTNHILQICHLTSINFGLQI